MGNLFIYLYEHYRFLFFLLFMIAVFSHKLHSMSVANKGQPLVLQVSKWLLSFLLCSIFCFAVSYFDFRMTGRYLWRILLLLLLALSIVYAVCSAIVSSFIVRYVYSFLHSKFWFRNAPGIIIFLFLSIQFVLNCPYHLQEWSAWSYAVDYSMGFASRMLIGTVLSVLCHGFVSESVATFFCVLSTLFLNGLIAFLLNSVINKANSTEKNAVIFLALCYISSPGSVASLWTAANWGRLELFNIIVTFFSVVCFCKLENVYLKYFALVILNCINIAIYQGFIFLFFPIIFMMMAFHTVQNNRIVVKHFVLAICVCLITAVMFLVFQTASSLKFDDAAEMAAALHNKSDLSINTEALYFEFFGPLKELFDFPEVYLTQGEYPREKCMLLFVFLLPFLILISYVFCHALSCEKATGRFYTSPLVYCLASLLFIVPQFLLTIDWGRWMTAFTTCAFFLVFYGIYINNSGISKTLISLSKFLSSQTYIGIFILLILGCMRKFEARVITSDFAAVFLSVQTILNKITDALYMLLH